MTQRTSTETMAVLPLRDLVLLPHRILPVLVVVLGLERAGAVAERRAAAVGVDDREGALPDRAAEEMVDQRHGSFR